MPQLRNQLQKSLIGPAGEHYVLYRLYQRGILASLAPPGAPTVDVLVMAPDEKVIATIQVKTRSAGSSPGWVMGSKNETFVQKRAFYAFVDFDPSPPATYIVPSTVVAAVLALDHQTWLALPGRGGQPHKDNDLRLLLAAYPRALPGFPDGWLDKYREKWELLAAAVGAEE